MSTTGAGSIARGLRARDVDVVFGLCGDHTNPLFEALDDEGIRIVDTRDERGAAWMAAGYALASGRPGVTVVSNTPAFTNAMTGLLDAQDSGIPVVCITGGVGYNEQGAGHPGDRNQAALAHGWAKWAAPLTAAHDGGIAVARALDVASRGPRGVSVLEVPLDMQHARCDLKDPPAAAHDEQVPDVTVVRDLLARAERPVIVAGEGCWWSDAGDALHALVERARIPVFTVRAARGLVSDDHELCMGFLNLLTPAAQIAFGEADVVLVVGARTDVLLGGGHFHEGATVVRVDEDPKAFGLGRAAQVQMHASPRAVLNALAEGAEALETGAWVKRLREAVDERRATVGQRASISRWPLHPGRLVAEIAAKLPANAIVCVDAGELALWAIDGIPARAPASFHASSFSPLGALGMGLPWAIGAKVARPDRPVLALVGDGSFGFTAMEIETSARHDAPVAVVVGNDGGWGIVRHLQQELHGRALASDLPVSPYELLAEFAGGVGDRVETPRQAAIAITNALVAPVPSVVNAIIDRNARHEAMALIAAMFRAKSG